MDVERWYGRVGRRGGNIGVGILSVGGYRILRNQFEVKLGFMEF